MSFSSAVEPSGRGRRALLSGPLAAVLAILALAVGLTACGGDSGTDDASADADGAAVETVEGVAAVELENCGPVEYGGEGEPQLLIVSDLPLQGASSERSEQMNDAIRIALDRADWSAGGSGVAFQPCDDTLADTGAWDAATCVANAEAYVENKDVVGVVGTYNSGCAAEMLPILNEGSVAMVSPGNTLVCLTRSAADCADDEPARFAPSGQPSYARVVPNDADQAAGLVSFAKGEGFMRPVVLFAADDPTSRGQAVAFRNAARQAGIPPVAMHTWDPEADDYTELMETVAGDDPDVVILAGLTEQNGGALIQAKVEALGPNDGDVALLAPDGFAQQSTIDEAGEDAEGMYVSVPGRAPSALTGAGAEVVAALAAEHDPVEMYAPYAAQAADVLLDAISRANGVRADVPAALFETEITDGVVGTFAIGPDGDPTINPITIFRAADTFEPVEEIEPGPALVKAARG